MTWSRNPLKANPIATGTVNITALYGVLYLGCTAENQEDTSVVSGKRKPGAC